MIAPPPREDGPWPQLAVVLLLVIVLVLASWVALS
jgi:hypothetical protein